MYLCHRTKPNLAHLGQARRFGDRGRNEISLRLKPPRQELSNEDYVRLKTK